MKVRMDDNDPCRFIVSSESETGVEYIVDLCQNPIGLDEDGNMDFNGACISTRRPDDWSQHGCRDFVFRCQPKLDRPDNMGRVFRCKHIKCARDYALKLLLPHMAKNRPNIPDEQQP